MKILLALYSTADRVIADAQAIQVPTQLLISGADCVVDRKPQDNEFLRTARIITEGKARLRLISYHDTLGEKDRAVAMEQVRRFIIRMFTRPLTSTPLLDADKAGYTKDEFDALSRPLPPLSSKSLLYGISKFGMRTGGRLFRWNPAGSGNWLRFGGSTLDYVYRNEVSGITPLGKLIDWFFINAIGWRGIRTRKQNVERLLVQAIAALRSKGQAVRILDIAAGQAGYVFETLENVSVKVDQILLWDYSEVNVRRGDMLIRKKGMQPFARFEQGDAFNQNELAAIRPRATLGVASGLYELFRECTCAWVAQRAGESKSNLAGT